MEEMVAKAASVMGMQSVVLAAVLALLPRIERIAAPTAQMEDFLQVITSWGAFNSA